LLLLLIVGSAIAFGNTRIISYNFWEYSTEITFPKDNIDNQQDIFDETIIHDIELDLSQQDYVDMISHYQAYEEKNYVKTQVIIDGVVISDVGVKLKGNEVLIWNIDQSIVAEIDFSFVIKFDEYLKTQSYDWKTEIALIAWGIDQLKGEYIAWKIFEKYEVAAPKMSFTKLTFADSYGTYLIKEVVDEGFITENYSDSNGLVYKAENSFTFTYLGEDPTAYTDLFTQKTLVNNYDLKKLIDVLEFVSQSSDEEFTLDFQKYIDIENYIKFLAINNILYKENTNIALLNSYYIYYDISEDVVRFIPWDSQYGTDIEDTSTYKILEKIYSIAEIAELSKRDIRELLGKVTGTFPDDFKTKFTNDLEEMFLQEETFLDLYTEVELQIQADLNESGFINFLEVSLDTLLEN
jgi:spore coat protein CotH